jgi:hypothetical protein
MTVVTDSERTQAVADVRAIILAAGQEAQVSRPVAGERLYGTDAAEYAPVGTIPLECVPTPPEELSQKIDGTAHLLPETDVQPQDRLLPVVEEIHFIGRKGAVIETHLVDSPLEEISGKSIGRIRRRPGSYHETGLGSHESPGADFAAAIQSAVYIGEHRGAVVSGGHVVPGAAADGSGPVRAVIHSGVVLQKTHSDEIIHIMVIAETERVPACHGVDDTLVIATGLVIVRFNPGAQGEGSREIQAAAGARIHIVISSVEL